MRFFSKIKLAVLCAFLSRTMLSFGQNYGITDDGKYVFGDLYSPKPDQAKISTVRSTSGSWSLELTDAKDIKFSGDSKYLFYLQNGDLHIQILGSKGNQTLTSVLNYSLEGRERSFLVYKSKSGEKLSIRNLKTQKEFSLAGVKSYFKHPIKNILFATIDAKGDMKIKQQLLEVDMTDQKTKVIWSSIDDKIFTYKRAFSDDGDRLAFFSTSAKNNSLWLYELGKADAKQLISDSSPDIGGQYHLAQAEGELKFVPNGQRIVFYLVSERKFPENKYRKEIENLNSYLDSKPNYYWRQDLKRNRSQLVSMDLDNKKLVFVEQQNDMVGGTPYEAYGSQHLQISNDYALVYHFDKEILLYDRGSKDFNSSTMSEFNFNNSVHPSLYLVNLTDGTRKLIKEKVHIRSGQFPLYELSPSGGDIVYFDAIRQHYFIYNIKTGKDVNISRHIATPLSVGERTAGQVSGLQSKYYNAGYPASRSIRWLAGEPAVLISDRFGDIWKLSLTDKPPICLTSGTAQKTGSVFSIENDPRKSLFDENEIIKIKATSGNYSRSSGYYQLIASDQPKLERLVESGGVSEISGYKKAKTSEMYVWSSSNFNLPPTVYYGKTLGNGQALVDRNSVTDPVKQEMLVWKDEKGNEHEGLILFPKNFDSTKTYPVLITYYTNIQSAGVTTKYLDHSNFRSELDLGYIVFIPNLEFEVGHTSASVTNIVVSGVQELKKRAYVNGKKIGIFGGSFSGYHTNCIVGQTDIFAAAFSIAGFSNLISLVNIESTDEEQMIHSTYTMNGQINMGTTLWERPDLYLANSPVFYADRVACPVLLYHGRQDYRVPFEQGMQFYKALKANGKKVWLIASDDGHQGGPLQSVSGGVKARQFFGHYLKDEPAPYWMTRSALELLEKGLDPYGYDPEIKTPGEGIIPKEKTYAPPVLELLKHRTAVDKNGRITDVKN